MRTSTHSFLTCDTAALSQWLFRKGFRNPVHRGWMTDRSDIRIRIRLTTEDFFFFLKQSSTELISFTLKVDLFPTFTAKTHARNKQIGERMSTLSMKHKIALSVFLDVSIAV